MNTSQTKPLITFAMMAYNDARFVEEALAAAFAQTYEPLEIIVSDDCSTDETPELIQKMAAGYRGPHTVVLNRNERNLGLSRHINRIMELCRGEIVVIAAADDVSLPHRVQCTYDALLASGGRAFSIHSSCLLINECGDTVGTAQEYEWYEADLEAVIQHGTWVYGCTHAWHRDIFDKFGPLPGEVMREDEVLPFRALLLGTIAYISEPLVCYRLHEENISSWHHRMARNRRDLHALKCMRLRERVVNLKAYLSDLEKAGDRVDPERRRALRERLLGEIEAHQVELTLRSGTFKERVEMLRQQNAKRFNPALMVKALLRILLPEPYKAYCYYRYRKIDCRSGEPPCGGPAPRTAALQQES